MEEIDIDKETNELFSKEINQVEKVQGAVQDAMDTMKGLYKVIDIKLTNDNFCVACNGQLKTEDVKEYHIVPVPNESLEKGICGFVGICDKCHKKFKEE